LFIGKLFYFALFYSFIKDFKKQRLECQDINQANLQEEPLRKQLFLPVALNGTD
jgi:hypothetical protein